MKNLFAKHKSFFIIFAVVFVLFWVLAILLTNYAWGVVLYCILLFPFGFLQIILGEYFVNRYYAMDHWIHNEFVGLFFILLIIIGQTFVYYYIYKFVKARKKRKLEIQE